MKISYECSDLIEELKKDIAEFGANTEFYAIFKVLDYECFGKKGKQLTLIDYEFLSDNYPELEKGEMAEIMPAKEILRILEEQNRLV